MSSKLISSCKLKNLLYIWSRQFYNLIVHQEDRHSRSSAIVCDQNLEGVAPDEGHRPKIQNNERQSPQRGIPQEVLSTSAKINFLTIRRGAAFFFFLYRPLWRGNFPSPSLMVGPFTTTPPGFGTLYDGIWRKLKRVGRQKIILEGFSRGIFTTRELGGCGRPGLGVGDQGSNEISSCSWAYCGAHYPPPTHTCYFLDLGVLHTILGSAPGTPPRHGK